MNARAQQGAGSEERAVDTFRSGSREACGGSGDETLTRSAAIQVGDRRPQLPVRGPSGRRPLPLRAFTLIEVLVSVALLGLLLIALNLFVFSMAEIWGHGAERRLFEQHVRAVTREVQTLARTAALPPIAAEPVLFAREVRLDDGRRQTLVSFELPAGSPRLPWKTTPLPDVVCSLVLQDGKGLVLYWQSRLERDFTDAAARPFVLSGFGSSMAFDYLESEGATWRTYDQLQRAPDGKWRMPERLRLKFTHKQMTSETTVTLPKSTVPLPHF